MWLKNPSFCLSSRLLDPGYLNMMEKSSPGDGFQRPKEFHRKVWWKKPLQHRNKNASWLSWELCSRTEFTFTAAKGQKGHGNEQILTIWVGKNSSANKV